MSTSVRRLNEIYPFIKSKNCIKILLLCLHQHLLNLPDFKTRLEKLEIPAYRAGQILHAVWREGKSDFSKISTLPRDLQLLLSGKIEIFSIIAEKIVSAPDGSSRKILFRLKDGLKIETVLMRFRDGRSSVCVSSQVGCQLGCKFCATGASGFRRNLNYEEIADQVLFCAQLLSKEDRNISNVVYMGMGEPFMNYDQVIESVKVLNDKKGLNLGARSITLSTAGICEGIGKLAGEKMQVNLAVSLHAPNQSLREKIMPIARKYDLKSLMASVRKYILKTNRRVSYEYVMLKGVNDSDKEARELSLLVKGQLCHINLIPYNATGIKGIAGSDRGRLNRFRDILKAAGIPVTIRVSLGSDIQAACGQLSQKYMSKSAKS